MSREAIPAAADGGSGPERVPGYKGPAQVLETGGDGETERERARLREAAREAHERAVAATRAKSEFLATMSHEMRTPLNAVLGYTELLALEVPGTINDEQRAYLDRIRAASSRLLSLINDVLDLTKIDAGRMVIARDRVEAKAVIRHAVAMVAQQAELAGVHIVTHCQDSPSFIGDRRRAEQILLQLLGNAIRFTGRGGKVTVSCSRFVASGADTTSGGEHHCWCVMNVEDTGIGIGDDHLTTIFDPFVQVESGHTRSRDGTGLGLAVGRRLARLMDGDLTVASRLGAGSTFTLWLPSPPVVHEDGSVTGCDTPERRGETRTARGLISAADAILRDLEGIVRRHVARLRDDELFLASSGLDDTELMDHTGTFLADLAQSLCIIEESDGEPTRLMRDGTEIQTLIANRHGVHRQSLGWTEHEIGREYGLLFSEIERVVRESAGEEGTERANAALALVKRFVERGCSESIAAYRRAAVGATGRRGSDAAPEGAGH